MIEQQTQPDPDAFRPWLEEHRRIARNRRFSFLTLAAVIMAVDVFAVITLQDGGDEGGPAETTSPSAFVPVIAGSRSYLDLVTGERTPVAVNVTGANPPEVSPNGEPVDERRSRS